MRQKLLAILSVGAIFLFHGLLGHQVSEQQARGNKVNFQEQAGGITLNILDFGAKGDGITNDKEAIQSALNGCAKYQPTSASPCVVLVPEPGRYLTGSISFNVSNTVLHIEELAIIEGSTNPADYNLTGPLPSYPIEDHHNSNPRFQALINGENLVNISVVGTGTIDAHGPHFNSSGTPLHAYQNPCVLEFLYCHNLLIKGIRILNGAYYHIHPFNCTDITVDSVTIVGLYHNADGIDPDSCSNVLIQNCDITTTDDSISLKSGKSNEGVAYGVATTNVSIIGNRFHVGSGVAIGSEMSGGVSHVRVFSNSFDATVNVVRFKSCPNYAGIVRDVAYVNNSIALGASAIFIDMHYECSSLNSSIPDPLFTDILVQSLVGDAVAPGSISCLPNSCTNWHLQDVIFHKHLTSYLPCENISNSTYSNTIPIPHCFNQ